jgi:hypothetical protein
MSGNRVIREVTADAFSSLIFGFGFGEVFGHQIFFAIFWSPARFIA